MADKVPVGAERREVIADAAIRLVATRGLKGLTHRAVDAEAGLPPGSTSYYLRTRDALLGACLNRMLERDLAGRTAMPSGIGTVELLLGMVLDLTTHRREDLLARYELSLEANRQPALQAVLIEAGTRLRAGLAEVLAADGIPNAEELAWPIAAMLDGLMYDRVAGAGSTIPAATFESTTRTTLTALLTTLTP
ncbi:TetR/AcrR family transcriptional regulator [Kribbella deserti]|uniref:TetR/AcrR family transcriptional regulator n=1 Tax=Kribbella deserti TaxID=1926257 RepID=A0ABV6QRK1_9ACTN